LNAHPFGTREEVFVRPSPTWFNRARRLLAVHVERLSDTLLATMQRLRETVAQAVSNHLASALREAVHALCTDSEPHRALPSASLQAPYRPRPTWGEPDPYDRDEDDADVPADDGSGTSTPGWREVAGEPPPATAAPGAQPRRVRWHRA
jgi:hypothetical protein